MHPNKGKLRRPWGGGWVNKDLITFLPHQALPSSIVQLAPPLPVLHLATSPPIYPHNKRRDVHVPFSWHGKPRLDQPLFSHLQDLGRSPSYLPPSCAKLSPNPESATPSGIHFPGAPQNNEGRSAHHKARLRHRPPAGQLMAVWAGGDDRVVGTTTTLRDGGGHGPCLSFPSFSLLVLPSSLTGAWCLGFILPCSNGLIDGKWLSIFSALMNEKRLLAPISQNRDASRKVSGTKEDQVGNDGMCFRDRTPSPFRAWLGDGRTRHHVYHPPGAWPMGVHSRRPHHYQSLPTPSPYRIHAHYSVTYVK